MGVIVVFAGDIVVAVGSGLLVTKEPEVDAEDFTINQNNIYANLWLLVE